MQAPVRQISRSCSPAQSAGWTSFEGSHKPGSSTRSYLIGSRA